MYYGIFEFLHCEGLTTLRMRYDYKTRTFSYAAGRDFEPELDFSRYNKDFSQTGFLTADNRCMGTAEVIDMFEQHGYTDHLERVENLVREGKHMGINFIYNARLNIKYICGIHSDVRGRNNKSYTTFAGATRRHGHDKPEIEVSATRSLTTV